MRRSESSSRTVSRASSAPWLLRARCAARFQLLCATVRCAWRSTMLTRVATSQRKRPALRLRYRGLTSTKVAQRVELFAISERTRSVCERTPSKVSEGTRSNRYCPPLSLAPS